MWKKANVVECRNCGRTSVVKVIDGDCPYCKANGELISLSPSVEISSEYIDVGLTPEQVDFIKSVYAE